MFHLKWNFPENNIFFKNKFYDKKYLHIKGALFECYLLQFYVAETITQWSDSDSTDFQTNSSFSGE